MRMWSRDYKIAWNEHFVSSSYYSFVFRQAASDTQAKEYEALGEFCACCAAQCSLSCQRRSSTRWRVRVVGSHGYAEYRCWNGVADYIQRVCPKCC